MRSVLLLAKSIEFGHDQVESKLVIALRAALETLQLKKLAEQLVADGCIVGLPL